MKLQRSVQLVDVNLKLWCFIEQKVKQKIEQNFLFKFSPLTWHQYRICMLTDDTFLIGEALEGQHSIYTMTNLPLNRIELLTTQFAMC